MKKTVWPLSLNLLDAKNNLKGVCRICTSTQLSVLKNDVNKSRREVILFLIFKRYISRRKDKWFIQVGQRLQCVSELWTFKLVHNFCLQDHIIDCPSLEMPWHSFEPHTLNSKRLREVNYVLARLYPIRVSLLKNELHKCEAFAGRHYRFALGHKCIHLFILKVEGRPQQIRKST